MSNDTTESSLVKATDHDAQIHAATLALTDLAEKLDDDTAAKVLQLSRLASPVIKGVEGQQRITIPQVYIRQPSSSSEVIPEECKIGQLYDSNGQAVGDTMEIIPILTYNIRKKWGDDQMECSSIDGEVGTRYGKCSECPYGRFEKGVRPECSPGHAFYVVTEDLENLYRIEFTKSSAKAGKNIRRLTLPPALWSRSFKVETEKKTGNNRNYYILKTSPTGKKTDSITMDVCDALHQFFQALYHKHREAQAAFAKRLAEGDTSASTGGEDIIVADDDDGSVIDFSDNM